MNEIMFAGFLDEMEKLSAEKLRGPGNVRPGAGEPRFLLHTVRQALQHGSAGAAQQGRPDFRLSGGPGRAMHERVKGTIMRKHTSEQSGAAARAFTENFASKFPDRVYPTAWQHIGMKKPSAAEIAKIVAARGR